jgi:hypothetical protein
MHAAMRDTPYLKGDSSEEKPTLPCLEIFPQIRARNLAYKCHG